MRELKVAVFEGFETGNAYDMFQSPTYSNVKTHSRKTWVIKRQIDGLYKKYSKFLEENIHPTHWLINDLDYAFIKAYFQYYGDRYYVMDHREKPNKLFGLKIVIYKGVTTLGWEP